MTRGPLLLTRPEAQSHRFAEECRAAFGSDLEVVIAPVLEIAPRETVVDLKGISALIFTSANGVRCFRAFGGSPRLPCYCVGARTARAAEALGLSLARVSDTAAQLMADILADTPPGALLHLHGAHVTGDLAGDLRRRGLDVREAVIYDQHERPLSEAGCAVLARREAVFLPVFSPRSAVLLAPYLAGAKADLHIAAISPAVAAALDVQSDTRLEVAARPDGAAMVSALSRLMKRGSVLER